VPLFGPYEIEALIGKGGMAEVYRANATEGKFAGRRVALKRLMPELAKDPHYVELFTNESDLSRMLHHPNVIEVLDAGVISNTYFIAMDFIDGRDLGQVLARCRHRRIQLPIDFAVFLVKTLLDALDYAHNLTAPSGKALHVVHCDVSPSNMFISRVGEIKLGDFGIAKVRSLEGASGPNKVFGKAYYLSPEQLDGKLGPSIDLWAAAVTLYELLTLERPFSGTTADEVARKIRSGQFRPVTEVRPEVFPPLAELLHKALSPNPADRFPTARAFSDALLPHFNELIGTPLAIAAVVRGLFGA
jgi:serine/threonine-protein kinase